MTSAPDVVLLMPDHRTYFNPLLMDGDANGTVCGLGGDSKFIFIW